MKIYSQQQQIPSNVSALPLQQQQAIATSTALLIVGLAATAAGTGYSVYQQREAGKAADRLAKYNASVSEAEAAQRQREAARKAQAQRAQGERLKARQRALYAKAGVVGEAGTPLLVQAQQAQELEMAALEIEQTGEIEAGRFRTQAVIERMGGASARRAGSLGATATLLQGVGQVASTAGSYYGTRSNTGTTYKPQG